MLHPYPLNAVDSDTYHQLAIFGDIFEHIRTQYVKPQDDNKLIQSAINGMLSSLDPHSSYMDEKAANEMQLSTKGEFGGIGIEVSMENHRIKIISPLDNSPAAQAGIRAGDLIIKINDEDLRGQNLDSVVSKMRGKVGTQLTLTLQRVNNLIKIKMTRAIIKTEVVRYRIEKNIGYIRILQFSEKTYDHLKKAIANLKLKIPQKSLKGYILDLRMNPGGLLDQAVNVASAFIEKGRIVSTKGRNPQDIIHFDTHDKDLTEGKPIIVLINGGSASASEIVAGALQDHQRATILGTQSFGKGSVQTIIPLEKGALRLTTALYYTPSGRSIQGKGITPDIIVEQALPDKLKNSSINYGESKLLGHIKGQEEDQKGSGSAAYIPQNPKTDIQLQEALKLLRGEMTTHIKKSIHH
jgi:carboxyl-terminal processing protease